MSAHVLRDSIVIEGRQALLQENRRITPGICGLNLRKRQDRCWRSLAISMSSRGFLYRDRVPRFGSSLQKSPPAPRSVMAPRHFNEHLSSVSRQKNFPFCTFPMVNCRGSPLRAMTEV